MGENSMGNTSLADSIEQLRKFDANAPDFQFEAAIALSQCADDGVINEVIAALIEALKEPQALARAHAAESLGTLSQRYRQLVAQKSVAALVIALQDSYRLVRSYADRYLGQLGDQSAVDPLLQVLDNDCFFGVRAEAAEALRKLCPNENSPISRLAREKLKLYRENELKRNEERSRRVLAEMDISLKELGAIMAQIEDALREGKSDYATTLARDVNAKLNATQDIRDRMGGLLASRDRLYAL